MATSYSGNLVAALATQNVRLPFKTLDELAEDNLYTLKIRVGGVHQSLLQVGTDRLIENKNVEVQVKSRISLKNCFKCISLNIVTIIKESTHPPTNTQTHIHIYIYNYIYIQIYIYIYIYICI